MKKLFTLCLSAFLLTGCASVEKIVNNDTSKEPDVTEDKDTTAKSLNCSNDSGETWTFTAEGNKIKTGKLVFSMNKSDLGITDEMDDTTVKDTINAALSNKYTLEGVTASGEMKEDKIEITLNIDYDKADDQALIDAGLMTEGEKQNQYVSIKKTKEIYENSNYSCSYQ